MPEVAAKPNPVQPKLLRSFRWYVARVMVDFGLPDRWMVRVNGECFEGLHSLDNIAELQRADSRAAIEIENRLGRCIPPDLGKRLEPTVKGQVMLADDGIAMAAKVRWNVASGSFLKQAADGSPRRRRERSVGGF
jgi:hypothetical protein